MQLFAEDHMGPEECFGEIASCTSKTKQYVVMGWYELLSTYHTINSCRTLLWIMTGIHKIVVISPHVSSVWERFQRNNSHFGPGSYFCVFCHKFQVSVNDINVICITGRETCCVIQGLNPNIQYPMLQLSSYTGLSRSLRLLAFPIGIMFVTTTTS